MQVKQSSNEASALTKLVKDTKDISPVPSQLPSNKDPSAIGKQSSATQKVCETFSNKPASSQHLIDHSKELEGLDKVAPLPNTADGRYKIPAPFSPDSINDRVLSPRSDSNMDLPIVIRNEGEQVSQSEITGDNS